MGSPRELICIVMDEPVGIERRGDLLFAPKNTLPLETSGGAVESLHREHPAADVPLDNLACPIRGVVVDVIDIDALSIKSRTAYSMMSASL